MCYIKPFIYSDFSSPSFSSTLVFSSILVVMFWVLVEHEVDFQNFSNTGQVLSVTTAVHPHITVPRRRELGPLIYLRVLPVFCVYSLRE